MAVSRRAVVAGVAACLIAGTASASRELLKVGPGESIPTLAVAARLVSDGTTIELTPGEYVGDVAVWTKDRITVRAVGGRARLIAAGASAEGKAIWVVRGGKMTVENIDFVGARVPDRNGAGIRLERGQLLVRNCSFLDNENGILTANHSSIELRVEGSEFAYNGAGDGYSHNLYAGTIGRLTVTGSYFHHARVGHLLKSRATENHIAYNRLTDGRGGRASYELEFPVGGIAYVIGNIVGQSASTENPQVVSFGAEGYVHRHNELYLVNNTLIDDRRRDGLFLRVAPGADQVWVTNNLLVGGTPLDSAGTTQFAANFEIEKSNLQDAERGDYRVRRDSDVVGKAIDPGVANGVRLTPDQEYRHPRQTAKLLRQVRVPGAIQSLAF